MARLVSISIVFALLSFSSYAQLSSAYIPLKVKGSMVYLRWSGVVPSGLDDVSYSSRYYDGDTIVANKVCAKLTLPIYHNNYAFAGAPNTGYLNYDDTINRKVYNMSATPPYLLYDFSLQPGDTFGVQELYFNPNMCMVLDSIVPVSFGTFTTRKFCLSERLNGVLNSLIRRQYIEGIGLWTYHGFESTEILLCFSDQPNSLIYEDSLTSYYNDWIPGQCDVWQFLALEDLKPHVGYNILVGDGTVKVLTQANGTNCTIYLTDLNGNCIASKTIQTGEPFLIENLQSACYVVRVADSHGIATQKVILR
ncbi:MAG: hypothetical protein RL660_3176 [Bacteroidota bacterium]|jgi:hypothetical protein